jgi:cytochrome c1
LDQFLEDLLDIGIPANSMVRLGGKSTDRTEPLSLHNAQKSNPLLKLTRWDWQEIDKIKLKLNGLSKSLRGASQKYNVHHIVQEAIMDHLKDHEPEYYRAFQVPPSPDGLQIVTKNNKPVFPNYLIDQWSKGGDAGVFKTYAFVRDASHIWKMSKSARKEKYATWNELILNKKVQNIHDLAKRYDATQAELDAKFDKSISRLLASKSIIGCTTTAAAKYRKYIHEAAPDVLLVEEAGEILESHIVTALGSTIKKLILIGDHRYSSSSFIIGKF